MSWWQWLKLKVKFLEERLFLIMADLYDDYIPYATCSDCGGNKIIPFTIKPFYPKCDGFCDACGCPWVKGVTVITPPKTMERAFQPVIPWGVILKSSEPKSNLFLIVSNKKIKEEVSDFKRSIEEIFPSDYSECKECGYDHQYDAASAARKHSLL
jgi:hypothetical protein